MNAFDNDIDKRIDLLQNQIDELEKQKAAFHKKFEGFEEFDRVMSGIIKDYSLTESEILTYKADAIESWIKSMGNQAMPPSIYTSLTNYFEKVIVKNKKKQNKPVKAKQLPRPRLPKGEYQHPYTNQIIEKKTRNPKELSDWIKEHGFAVVRTWLKKSNGPSHIEGI